jgi:hypothetical protein
MALVDAYDSHENIHHIGAGLDFPEDAAERLDRSRNVSTE